MINSRMTTLEILKEYWNDYSTYIRISCFNVVKRNSKDLIKLQRSKFGKSDPPQDWWYISKKIRSYNSPSGNKYKVLLKMKLVNKLEVPVIKTVVYTEILDSIRGSKMLMLFPSDETQREITVFSAKFIKEYRELENIDYSDTADTFFQKIMSEKFYIRPFLDKTGPLNLIGTLNKSSGSFGLGKIEITNDYQRYKFIHYLNKDLILKMTEKFKDISNLIELWEAYNSPKEIKIDPLELIDWEEQDKLEKQNILNEIFDKYENN